MLQVLDLGDGWPQKDVYKEEHKMVCSKKKKEKERKNQGSIGKCHIHFHQMARSSGCHVLHHTFTRLVHLGVGHATPFNRHTPTQTVACDGEGSIKQIATTNASLAEMSVELPHPLTQDSS